MYNLSSTAHAVVQHLKQHDTTTPTRSQVLELLAAYLGYKTYTSFKADTAISEEKLKAAITDRTSAYKRLLARLTELKLPTSIVGLLENSFVQQLQVANLVPTISLLRIARHLGISAAGTRLNAKETKAGYAFLRNSEDPEAVLLRYVWQRQELDDSLEEDDSSLSGGSLYWYEQRQAGVPLSAAASEWANSYERQLVANQQEQTLIQAYSCEQIARPLFSDVIQGKREPNLCWHLHASHLLYLIDGSMLDKMTDEFIYDWECLAVLQRPSHESLVELVAGLNDDVEVWAWYMFGLSQQIDITGSNYWLVNSDTGAEWDEDGPAMPDGYDGIELPKISEAENNVAKLIAQRMQTLMSLV
ncbi:hypothetical protein [Rheinheimera pacifica]|uniref:hypothetical protein n=1 Tax=Rheinheimera pacifica TaxID=173990 RepID=UPI002EDA492C